MRSPGSTLRSVLWNDRERRPRTPWRLLLGAVIVVVVTVVGALPWVVLGVLQQEVATVAGAVLATTAQITTYGALAAGILLAAWAIDRRTLGDLGLGWSRAWWRDLGFGLALGAAMPGAVLAVELALGYAAVTGTLVRRTGSTLPPTAGGSLALAFGLTAVYFVAVGLFEELIFRGYLLTNVAEGFRGLGPVGSNGAAAIATVATSVLFGLVHAANPNATSLAVLFISLYGGFLAAGYLLTGRIAIPVGVHVTWNLSVSSVYGFPVSGVTTPVTLVAVEQSGPDLVTGGAFGPEGGVVSLVALGIGTVALAGWVRWREGELRVRSAVARPELRFNGDDDRETGDASTSADG